MTTPDVRIRHDILSREEVVCEKPLLTVDRQMGLNTVHPVGKVQKNLFFNCSGSDCQYLLYFWVMSHCRGKQQQQLYMFASRLQRGKKKPCKAMALKQKGKKARTGARIGNKSGNPRLATRERKEFISHHFWSLLVGLSFRRAVEPSRFFRWTNL